MTDSEVKHPIARRVDRILAAIATFIMLGMILPNLGRPDVTKQSVVYGWTDAACCAIYLTPGLLVWFGSIRKSIPALVTAGWSTMAILFFLTVSR